MVRWCGRKLAERVNYKKKKNPQRLQQNQLTEWGCFLILGPRRYWTLGKLTILEEMGCTTALGLYLITTCCHANMPCLLPQASDDQMCHTCGKVHSFTHSLSKCFGGACLNKQIWRLTWFMSSASSPSANDAVHPNPLTTLSCLLTHSRFPPHRPACAHTSPLFCLVKSPASFRAQCTSSKDSLQWVLPPHPQPILRTSFYHRAYHTL